MPDGAEVLGGDDGLVDGSGLGELVVGAAEGSKLGRRVGPAEGSKDGSSVGRRV